MVRLFSKNPIARLRASRAYLSIILGCTLILFCFSLISANETREDVELLSSNNQRLTAEAQMARDLETRMQELAESCLSRQTLDQIKSLDTKEESLEDIARLRRFFDGLKKNHPMAHHFFVFSGSHLIFPHISAPPPVPLKSLIASGSSRNIRTYWERIRNGEYLENHERKPFRAAEAYHSAERLEIDARFKAFALFRTAGALEKANRPKAAAEAYQRLLNSYGDLYDESQTPYILSMASNEGSSGQALRFKMESLREIYSSLVAGRWELSAEQVDFHKAKLEQRLQPPPDRHQVSDFLDHLQFARDVNQEVEASLASPPYKVISQGIQYEARPRQLYCVSLPGYGGRQLTIGFSVSMSWINNSLLPKCAKKEYAELGNPIIQASSTVSKNVAHGVRFLQFWNISISEGIASTKTAAKYELWFVGLSAFMFLCILGLCFFLLLRVSSDIRWFQLRTDFVSGVSHEFKTPLSLIRLYSETLARDGQEAYSPEDRRNYVRIIARESERMSRMIDNVLDFSKMERGVKRPHLSEGDLTATISETIQDYSEYLAWRGFSIKSSFWPELPPVKFVPEQVSQMLLNLLDNARKYSGASRLIRVNVWVDQKVVVVEVQDNGMGIAAEEMEKIFQPFYRISRGSEKGGCGLGLYLVDQVMKEHGGTVEVDSEVNQGSRFRLIFPISGSEKIPSRRTKAHSFGTVQTEEQA